IIDTELFKVLRKKWGKNINCILSEKLIPISGDISDVNLGITDKELINEICGEIDFIINSAATTRFDERYDVSMDINAFGPLNVLNFAKRCSKLKLLLHVSTAYVHGSRLGVLEEEAIEMGKTLEGAKASCLDIEGEMKLIEEAKKQLHDVNQNEFTSTLRDLGIQRANFHGWPNTYSYTKAIGEMNLGYFNNSNIHVIIIRPSVISSTHKDPFPGWIEGLKTIDTIIVPYAKRKLNFFVCDPNVTLDVIPGDMVVNSMLAAIAADAQNECNKLSIYNVDLMMPTLKIYEMQRQQAMEMQRCLILIQNP
ncbi:fatty acid reductase 1, partial [Perilla frutescens var. hirtella]